MSDKRRSKNKTETRLPVDGDRWGRNDNAYDTPPTYYYDLEYDCCDCGEKETWSAQQQQHWYEELGKTVNSYAKRCRVCRAHISASKEDQKRHMEKMATRAKHPNEKFFSNT